MIAKALQRTLDAQGVPADAEALRRLQAFVALLQKWNRVYNLIGRASNEQLLSLHLADSLSIYPYLAGERIADVGTGAGFPGLVLAMVSPQRHFTLIDSNSKKTRFLTQAMIELGLDNVAIHSGRCEDMQPGGGFDTVTARAFAALPEAVRLLQPLLAPEGRILLMKARQARQELEQLQGNYDKKILRLEVPGLAAERNLVILKPIHKQHQDDRP